MDEIRERTVDPVCGEDVEPGECLYQARYMGKVYYFCCLNCQLDFQEAPEQYVNRYA